MKTLFSLFFLAFASTVNIVPAHSKMDVPAEPEFVQSLVGKWQFEHFDISQKNPDGSVKTSGWNAKERTIDIVWEFRPNGEFVAYDNKSGDKASGKWKLDITVPSGPNIAKGKLTITGAYAEQAASLIGDGTSLVYDIYSTSDGSSPAIFVTMDASKASPTGLETKFKYTYRKL